MPDEDIELSRNVAGELLGAGIIGPDDMEARAEPVDGGSAELIAND